MTGPEDYLEALGARLGLELKMDATGAVALASAEGAVLLRWLEQSRAFVFYADIGQAGPYCREQIFLRMLKANFLLSETGGGAVSFNEVNFNFGLNFLVPLDGLDPDAFPDRFLKMLNSAAQMRKALRKYRALAETTAEHGSQFMMQEHWP